MKSPKMRWGFRDEMAKHENKLFRNEINERKGHPFSAASWVHYVVRTKVLFIVICNRNFNATKYWFVISQLMKIWEETNEFKITHITWRFTHFYAKTLVWFVLFFYLHKNRLENQSEQKERKNPYHIHELNIISIDEIWENVWDSISQWNIAKNCV